MKIKTLMITAFVVFGMSPILKLNNDQSSFKSTNQSIKATTIKKKPFIKKRDQIFSKSLHKRFQKNMDGVLVVAPNKILKKGDSWAQHS